MKIPNPGTVMNITIFILIILRIITWRRHISRHKPVFSWLAWLLSVSSCIIIVFLLTDAWRFAEWAETVINGILCAALYCSDGNVAHLFKDKK
ncbi:TPA: phage holin family protein [Salmonella enterica]|nr:phage holin family protein [Salmonella enterica subsp. houtenae]HCL4435440.1 phage holin family protein [Salmonella enterica]HCL5082571.1 phage holin family protein [Salmonella enterica]